MSESFRKAWRRLHGIEGDFADDPNDSGGATRYGVTEPVARADGYTGPMSALPLDRAEAIAKRRYWDVLELDAVAAIAGFDLAYELMDSAYHAGPQKAGRWLQRALNALNMQQELYADVVNDGVVGDDTLRALNRFVTYRKQAGVSVLLKTLNCLQGAFYVDLVEKRQKDETFFFGWVLNRVVI